MAAGFAVASRAVVRMETEEGMEGVVGHAVVAQGRAQGSAGRDGAGCMVLSPLA